MVTPNPSVKPIPDGYTAITPYLMVDHVAETVAFLKAAFDATVNGQLSRPDGTIMHTQLEVRGSKLMMGSPMGEFGAMPTSIYLYVEDCDAVYARAMKAGGTSVMDPTDMTLEGERYGGVTDPSGNIWWIATHIEDVSWEEQARRVAALAEGDFEK